LKTVLFATGGGLGIGLLVALVALVVVVYTSRTFSTAGDVERSLNLKVVGTFPLQQLQAVGDKGPHPERQSPDPGALP